MAAKHTPGPWVIQDGFRNPQVYAKDQLLIVSEKYPGIKIARVTYRRSQIETDFANARLMSTAPEMLQFLIDFLYEDRNGDFNEGIPAGTIDQINELIAKATGTPRP